MVQTTCVGKQLLFYVAFNVEKFLFFYMEKQEGVKVNKNKKGETVLDPIM